MNFKDLLAYIFGSAVLFIAVPSVMIYLGVNYTYDFMPIGLTSSIFGAICSAVGLFFVIWSNYELIKKGHGGAVVFGNVKLTKQTDRLVTEGPYSLCRNPMHMGIVLFYLGLCCAINSLITLVIPCLFLIFAQIVAVYIDEPRLKRGFPEEYSQWVQKVPQRIWPKPKKG